MLEPSQYIEAEKCILEFGYTLATKRLNPSEYANIYEKGPNSIILYYDDINNELGLFGPLDERIKFDANWKENLLKTLEALDKKS